MQIISLSQQKIITIKIHNCGEDSAKPYATLNISNGSIDTD